MGLKQKKQLTGFTLIELVIVLIVLGVLAAVAIPKFASRGGFEHYTVRDQLIARLRLVQLQAMNSAPSEDAVDNACYWVIVNDDCFYNAHSAREAGSCTDGQVSNVCSDTSFNDYGVVNFPSGMLSAKQYRFDIQGLLVEGDEDITVIGDKTLLITIEQQGFIHAEE